MSPELMKTGGPGSMWLKNVPSGGGKSSIKRRAGDKGGEKETRLNSKRSHTEGRGLVKKTKGNPKNKKLIKNRKDEEADRPHRAGDSQ